jgi:hypothetical protein
MVRVVGLIALGLLLAGCGSSENQAGARLNCSRLPGGAATPRLSPEIEARETMYLTDVDIEALECTDRVVFSFRKAAPGPGYNISYEPAATAKTEDGSGNFLEVDGSYFLVVRLTPAMSAEIVGEEVKPTYTGPRRITPGGTTFVREVVKTGDFEAQVTWVIGLNEKRVFTATASDSELVVELG